MFRKLVTKEEALKKIKHYCNYQERSHYETKERLYSFGLRKHEVEELIALLIETNELNEERFACKFTKGRFKLKKWGRKKIEHELKQKCVSVYNIKTALKQINEEEYGTILKKLAGEKWDSLKGEQYLNRQVKTINYLLQKGYEHKLVQEAINEIREERKQ
jgi:regulatory protein